MKILLATHHLLQFTGSEIFTFEIARQLKKKGHDVDVYSPFIGSFRQLLSSEGISCTSDLLEYKNHTYDIAHVHHNIIAYEVRAVFPNLPIVYLSQGISPFLEQYPKFPTDIATTLAISENVAKHQERNGAKNVGVFRNMVDSNLFKSTKKINTQIKTAYIHTNRLQDSDYKKIESVLKKKNILITNNPGVYGEIENSKLPRLINIADLVITSGRGAIEAMMMGRAVLIYDYQGFDGLVTPQNYEKFRSNTFNGTTLNRTATTKAIETELKLYNPDDVYMIQNRVYEDFSSEIQIKKLIDIYEKTKSYKVDSSKITNKLHFITSTVRETRNYATLMNNMEIDHLHKKINSHLAKNRRLKQELTTTKKIINMLELNLQKIQSAKTYKLWQLFNRLKKISMLFKAIRFLLKNGLKKTYQRAVAAASDPLSLHQQYQSWIKQNYPTQKQLAIEYKQYKRLRLKPKISIILPTYNTHSEYLKEVIDSVIVQSYPEWELCIIDDNSSNEEVREIISYYASNDTRIKYKFRKKNGHISKASNDGLELATGDYVGLLDHDDLLWPNALFEVVKTINKNPNAKLIYTDEDKLMDDGYTHTDPFFKPDWSPDYLRSINYITHFAVLKSDLLHKIGGFRDEYIGAQDWDLFIRATNYLDSVSKNRNHPYSEENQIIHIPKILYSWRMSENSTASEEHAQKAKGYAYKNQQLVLENDLQSRNADGKVEETDYIGSWHVNYFVQGSPLVSIIIPTKDQYNFINKCLHSIKNKTEYDNYNIVIVDTGSTDPRVLDLYKKITSNRVSVVEWKKKFNFSAVCNYGASKTSAEYYLFLNNDTEVITKGWLQRLLGWAQQSHIGAVSAKLLYPDYKIQHLGGLLGISGDSKMVGIAGHAFRGQKEFFRHHDRVATKDYSFVTGACLMISKYNFNLVGGFDEAFKVAFNDIDLCLKLNQKNLFTVVDPFVELIHKESASLKKPGEDGRDIKLWEKEIERFRTKWEKYRINDPFFNENFRRDSEGFNSIVD